MNIRIPRLLLCLMFMVTSCERPGSVSRGTALSPIAEVDYGQVLERLAESTPDVRLTVANGGRIGGSGEWSRRFEAPDETSRKILTDLYREIDSKVSGYTFASGTDGTAPDGTLVAAHWVYRYERREGAIRIRLIETGDNESMIIIFLHE